MRSARPNRPSNSDAPNPTVIVRSDGPTVGAQDPALGRREQRIARVGREPGGQLAAPRGQFGDRGGELRLAADDRVERHEDRRGLRPGRQDDARLVRAVERDVAGLGARRLGAPGRPRRAPPPRVRPRRRRPRPPPRRGRTGEEPAARKDLGFVHQAGPAQASRPSRPDSSESSSERLARPACIALRSAALIWSKVL